SLAAGDIVIIPHGDAHSLFAGAPSMPLVESTSGLLGPFPPTDLHPMRSGGGGSETRFICGYFACERYAERLFLAGLPGMLKVSVRGDAAGQWLENSIRHLVGEAASGRPGGAVLLSKMAEALFIETLRRHMAQLPPEQTGWLAAARDPIVGAALALLHREPARAWTVTDLALTVGASRSVVAERFTHLVGEPPLAYLAHWRLQLAARLLETTKRTVIQVAGEVGYESEAAFNRAFKREFDSPPAQYRKGIAGRTAPPQAA
ncbi:MAG: AraC family transcriptional regulator, partial [Propionivibrio sp.]